MEQVQNHRFTVQFIGPFVMYMFSVPKAPLLTPNEAYIRAALRYMIRACGQDPPPAHLLAIPNNRVHSLNPDLLSFLLIRNANDDNDVFGNAPDIATMRNTWDILYCNMSNLRLRAVFAGANDNNSIKYWPADAIYHGMVHMTGVYFIELPGAAVVGDGEGVGDGDGVGESVAGTDYSQCLRDEHADNADSDADSDGESVDSEEDRDGENAADNDADEHADSDAHSDGESSHEVTQPDLAALLKQINSMDMDQIETLQGAIDTRRTSSRL
jgi:hypothetical protein